MDALLAASRLVKEYPGFTLRNVSFSLPPGYVMGLIGANGAGKTTVIKIILNLVREDAGEVRVFGLDHRDDESAIKDRIGFVHETHPFYDHMRVGRFARLLAPFYTRWSPDTFERLVREFELPADKKIRELSRGMRTKLALAISLSHNADLLLLDEPTSGLDPVFRRELLDMLREFIQDGERSVLFSTHITSDLERIADYVTMLREGEIVFSENRETIGERWTIVKGGNDRLTTELRGLLRFYRVSSFGFTGLTERPAEIRRITGDSVLFERATLEDLVCGLEGEERK